MSPVTAPLLDVRRLTRTYDGKRGLYDVAFSLHPGEVLGVVGPNGAGKTTLLECLLGLRQADAAEVFWEGEAVRLRPGVWDGRMGAQMQGEALPGLLTVRECFELHGAYDLECRSFEDLLEQSGLAPWGDKRVGSLSTGLRQRVSVALAFQPRARLVVLDEPTAALDAESRALLRKWVRQSARAGIAFLIASHDLLDASLLFDRTLVLESGRIQRIDTGGGPAGGRAGVLRINATPALSLAQILLVPGLLSHAEAMGAWTLEVTDVGPALAAVGRFASGMEAGAMRLEIEVVKEATP